MAHMSQSRPASGLDFQVKVLKTFEMVPFALGRGIKKKRDSSSSFLLLPSLELSDTQSL